MFADVFNNILFKTRISQKELAYTAGISESEISKYLNGMKEPKYTQLVNLSKALNIPISEFFPDSSEKFFEIDIDNLDVKNSRFGPVREYSKFLVRPMITENDNNLFVYKFYTIEKIKDLKFIAEYPFILPTSIKLVKGSIELTNTENNETRKYKSDQSLLLEENKLYTINIEPGTAGYIITTGSDIDEFRKVFHSSLKKVEAA